MIIQVNDKSVVIRVMLIYRHLATYERRSQLGHHRSSRRDKLELSVPLKTEHFPFKDLFLAIHIIIVTV